MLKLSEVTGSLLVTVPFRSKKGRQTGIVCLESLHMFEKMWQNSGNGFERLGRVFSVAYDNITLWMSLEKSKVQLETENLYYRTHSDPGMSDEIVGHSPAVTRVKELINKVAPLDVTVLIQGETGSGKELIARAIYRNSPRKEGPFIVVNIASIPTELMASTLFGHERGAFTGAVSRTKGLFEMADGGTLFLDD